MADDWQTPEFRQIVVTRINEVLQTSGQGLSKNATLMENHIHRKARNNEEYLGLLATLFMRFTEMISRGQVGRLRQAPNLGVNNANVVPDPSNANQGNPNAQEMPMGSNQPNQLAPGPAVDVPASNQQTDGLASTSGRAKSQLDAGQGSSKRVRQDETVSPNTEKSKKPKQGRLRVAVVDYGNPERKLSDEQWSITELKILDGIIDAILNKEEVFPRFGQNRNLKGFRLMECENQETLVWLEGFIANMAAPWPNADLRVADKGEIMNLTKLKGRFHFPGVYIPKKRIELLLQHLNTEVHSQDWTVTKVGEYINNGMDVDVLLGHKSLAPLREQDFMIRVGITCSRLRVPVGKWRVSRGLGVPP